MGVLRIQVLVLLTAILALGCSGKEKPVDQLKKAIRNISSLDGVQTETEKQVLSESIAIIKKSAAKGQVDAMYWMSEGRHLDASDPNYVSLKDSVNWLQKAAMKGHVDAPFVLGDLFSNSDEIKNSEKAYLWYAIGFFQKHSIHSAKDMTEEQKTEFLSEENVSLLTKQLGDTKVKEIDDQAWKWISANTPKK